MLKALLALPLLALGLLAPAMVSDPAQAAAELRLAPAEIRQGQAIRIEVRPDPETSLPLKVQVAGQSYELFAVGETQLCYVGLPADQKTGGYTLKVIDAEGKEVASEKIEVRPVARSSQNIRFYRPALTAEQQKILDQEEELVKQGLATRTPEQFWQGAFSVPVPHRISAVYGVRRYLNGKYNGYHGGVDFLSPAGTPIKAPAAGKVALARYFSKPNSNGNLVLLDHGLGVTSVYLHLSKILVKEGQAVKKGEPVALVGSTGRSTGPHLHWGVYINGKNTDAMHWIQFTGK